MKNVWDDTWMVFKERENDKQSERPEASSGSDVSSTED
jgi:hypothetical protein